MSSSRSSKDLDQRDKDRHRRHEHRSSRADREERWSHAEGDRRHRGDDNYDRRNRYDIKRSGGYGSDQYDKGEKQYHRDHHHYRDYDHERIRNRDRSRDLDKSFDHSQEEKREEIPNNTIILRNLGCTVTEVDIKKGVTSYGLEAKDIRLVHKIDSNRSFAFVEFSLLSDAIRWKELTKGVLILDGVNRSTLHYSIPRLSNSDRKPLDWNCAKCGVNNFRRRETCFKCNSIRDESIGTNDGLDEISPYPSNTLLFRNLDVLTTEERVLSMLGQLTALPIKSLKVAKDRLTNTSKGFAFVELHSTTEATQLHDLLLSMGENFFVDGRKVTVSYARRSLTAIKGTASANAAIVALAAAQWTNQDADNSAVPEALGSVVVNGVTYHRYPVPNVSLYQYDETSGYYYDSSTGLYYDSNSRYYYNSEKQQYFYWDNENQTYLPAAAMSTTSADNSKAKSTEANASVVVAKPPEPPKKEETAESSQKAGKSDKVKIAKKIAKDMEKWAKTLNQKKENAKLSLYPSYAASSKNSATTPLSSADVGFAVLEKRSFEKNDISETFATSPQESPFMQLEKSASADDVESDTEMDDQDEGIQAYNLLKAEEHKLIDWDKLACLMCKRQFASKDMLSKHQQMSDLHKQNLDVLKLTKLTPRQMQELERQEKEAGYRDRAKERRQKFGQPDVPPPNKLKSKFLKGREEMVQVEQPTKLGIGSDNIGNKMLKAMGWTEGQGLGKSGQGMSGIIEVQQRSKTAGLGMKGATYGATAGDSYKEAVKKAMQARFKEISDQ